MKKSVCFKLVVFAAFSVLLFSSFAFAGNVAYVYRNVVDENVVSTLNDEGHVVSYFHEWELPVDWSEFDAMFVGDEAFRNRRNIPVGQVPTILANARYGYEWGLTDRDGLGRLGATKVLDVQDDDSVTQVYTSARDRRRLSVSYYYIPNQNVVEGTSMLAGTMTGWRGYNIGAVVAHLAANEYRAADICFFGIASSDYWTPEARDLFEDCFDLILGDNDQDEDNGVVHDVAFDEGLLGSVGGVRLELTDGTDILEGESLVCGTKYKASVSIENLGDVAENVSFAGSVGSVVVNHIVINNFLPADKKLKSRTFTANLESGDHVLIVEALIDDDVSPENNVVSRLVNVICPVDADADGFMDDVDCNDADDKVYPGAVELCEDGVDNDCNGLVDLEDAVCEVGGVVHDVAFDTGLSGSFGGLRLELPDGTDILEGESLVCGAKYRASVSIENFGNVAENVSFSGDFGSLIVNHLPIVDLLSADKKLKTKTFTANLEPGSHLFTVEALINEDVSPSDNFVSRIVDVICLLDADADGFNDDVDCNDENDLIFPGAEELCFDEVDNNCDALIDAEDVGACEDADFDDDGVEDINDPDPLNNFVCGDSDGDLCDDCAILGEISSTNDGPDYNEDGICDLSDPPVQSSFSDVGFNFLNGGIGGIKLESQSGDLIGGTDELLCNEKYKVIVELENRGNGFENVSFAGIAGDPGTGLISFSHVAVNDLAPADVKVKTRTVNFTLPHGAHKVVISAFIEGIDLNQSDNFLEREVFVSCPVDVDGFLGGGTII